MTYKEIKIEKKDHIAIVTLNAPKNLNALGKAISEELKLALNECENDPEVRVVILKGEGRAFSSGGNLKEMKESFDKDPEKYMIDLLNAIYLAIPKVKKLPKPVIASVHGFAFGAGMNLALACDFVIAEENTLFSESFVKVGLIAAGHSTLILPKLIGLRKATDLCLTGRRIKAKEAFELGLINKVVPKGELETETLKLAKELAALPPIALQETKKLLHKSYYQSEEKQAEDERNIQIKMANTEDYKEGINSFFEKRKPEFKGK
ncbi:MAG: enoyl-CoA hydratase/isomerase family protein [Candidatus Helarchaeota archaeon]